MILDCNNVDLLYNESICSFVQCFASAVNREREKKIPLKR